MICIGAKTYAACFLTVRSLLCLRMQNITAAMVTEMSRRANRDPRTAAATLVSLSSCWVPVVTCDATPCSVVPCGLESCSTVAFAVASGYVASCAVVYCGVVSFPVVVSAVVYCGVVRCAGVAFAVMPRGVVACAVVPNAVVPCGAMCCALVADVVSSTVIILMGRPINCDGSHLEGIQTIVLTQEPVYITHIDLIITVTQHGVRPLCP